MKAAEIDQPTLAYAESLARDVLVLARDELLSTLRFLNRPLAMLPACLTYDRHGCATDGRKAYFAPGFALASLEGATPEGTAPKGATPEGTERKESEKLVTQAYLHMVLHCLLGHPFPAREVNPLRWSVACDLAVWCVMESLSEAGAATGVFNAQSNPYQAEIVHAHAQRCASHTAPAFYRLLEQENTSTEKLASLEITLGFDAHDLWFSESDNSKQPDASSEPLLAESWENIARATQLDAAREEAGSKQGSLTTFLQNTAQTSAVGLEELMRELCAPSEEITASPDEFDYLYYLHGLNYLGNVALVEPLEYVEKPHFRDFVLAIDTSGSVAGRLVEGFIRKVCGLLLEGSFDEKTRVRIVQCDSAIQDVRMITTYQQACALADTFTLQGFGGTDFRPVFDYADNLLETGETQEIAAVVYFTDGKGEFPHAAPAYNTAFVFLDEAGNVPFWATKALVYSDELTSQETSTDPKMPSSQPARI